ELDVVVRQQSGQPLVKVYPAGNFFDVQEVPPEIRERILRELGDRCDKVIVETLSHLLRVDQLERAVQLADQLEVAFGLESTGERVLRYAVNKVWGLPEHAKAAAPCHEAGVAR